MDADDRFHVTFVCTGNICRSPMAEKIFAEHLRREGLDDRVRVSSAGTHGWHVGSEADPRTDAVLQRHGFPAMVYLISGMLGQPSSWFAQDGRATPPLMSAERVRQLRREGIDFGSHSASHVKLAEQSGERIRDEVTRSKRELEDVLGEPVAHFCYPYGSHDLRAVEAVAEAGYRCATTCVRAPATSADDPLTLPRKAVSWGDNLLGLFWRLHMKNTPKQAPIRRPGQSFARLPA